MKIQSGFSGSVLPGYVLPGSSTPEAGISGYPIGASFIAITIFFLIAFSSNSILASVNLANLGITVTLSTLIFMGIVIFILFVL